MRALPDAASAAIPDAFIVTCEHGGNRIPTAYRALFAGHESLLKTHRGYDPGALVIARTLAVALVAPLVAATTSRLLVDLNRSIGHPQLFSEATRSLPADERKAIIEAHYLPYRRRVEDAVRKAVARGQRIVHISAHSFTPELHGSVRRADVGFLYDPRRAGEAQLCARWKAVLEAATPALRVRRNYPYVGKADGQTATLRRRFASEAYVGIELEVNQAIVFAGGRRWRWLRGVLCASLRAAALP